MCGRYALTIPPDAARRYFGYREHPNFPPRFDIRPTDPVPVVAASEAARHFMLMRWGFVPAFVKDEKTFPLLINARSETVFEKPSFRNAIRRRRCLFMADAFYEWMKLDEKGRKKQPYRIFRPSGEPIALAGIHETWMSPEGSEIDTCAILTTSANATVSAIHDRMPVIIEPHDFDAWFSLETSREELTQFFKPATEEALALAPISKLGPPEAETLL